MALREIPEGAELLQTGLYIYRYQITIGGVERTLGGLYSSEGYCFYDLTDEIYDEEGNLIPEEDVLPSQRTYAQYMGLPTATATKTNEELNQRFVSVPVDDSYNILTTNPPVVEI